MSLRLVFTAGLALTTALACERSAQAQEEVARVRPAYSFAGGATTSRLLGLAFNGGLVRAGIAAETSEHVSLGGDVEYTRAATDHGLLMQVGRLDFNPTYVAGRFHLGAGPHLTLLVIERESGGGAIRSLGVGAHASVALDLVRLGEHGALFIAIKPSIAKMSAAVLCAGDAALGLRF